MAQSDHYKAAGVDIDLAGKLLRDVKKKLAAATRPEVLAPVGGFGGLFQLDLSRWREPVLVSSVDGVGTKLMVALQAERHDGVGHDIVNHCINDVAVQGAEPLYFLDYLGIGRLRSPLYEQVLAGVADACAAQGVALLGGETAEMPGMYADHYDLVGCIVGCVDRSQLITGDRIAPGHRVIGLAGNGLHTNGYSLARRILFEQCDCTVDTDLPELGETVGEALLRPHPCYWPAIRAAMDANLALDGLAHITGGGWYDNVPRILPTGVDAVLKPGVLPVPPIFTVLADRGEIEPAEMHRVFNMGVGMMWFVPAGIAEQAVAIAREAGCEAAEIGEIVPGDGQVRLHGIDC